LEYLAKTAPGSRWTVSVVIDRVYRMRDFDPSEAEQIKRSINFDAVSIELNRGEQEHRYE